jgi:hypothetical protein
VQKLLAFYGICKEAEIPLDHSDNTVNPPALTSASRSKERLFVYLESPPRQHALGWLEVTVQKVRVFFGARQTDWWRSRAYRRFESPSLRQQVTDITRENVISAIVA